MILFLRRPLVLARSFLSIVRASSFIIPQPGILFTTPITFIRDNERRHCLVCCLLGKSSSTVPQLIVCFVRLLVVLCVGLGCAIVVAQHQDMFCRPIFYPIGPSLYPTTSFTFPNLNNLASSRGRLQNAPDLSDQRFLLTSQLRDEDNISQSTSNLGQTTRSKAAPTSLANQLQQILTAANSRITPTRPLITTPRHPI